MRTGSTWNLDHIHPRWCHCQSRSHIKLLPHVWPQGICLSRSRYDGRRCRGVAPLCAFENVRDHSETVIKLPCEHERFILRMKDLVSGKARASQWTMLIHVSGYSEAAPSENFYLAMQLSMLFGLLSTDRYFRCRFSWVRYQVEALESKPKSLTRLQISEIWR